MHRGAMIAVLIGILLAAAVASAGESVRTSYRHDANGSYLDEERLPVVAEHPYEAPATAFLGGSESTGILWHRPLASATFTTCQISMPTTTLCAGTYLNPPKELELIPLEGTGVPDWVYAGTDFRAAASRDADVIVGVDYEGGSLTATVYKWSPGSSTPDWSYVINSCSLGSSQQVVVSPDGSTIAVAVTMQAPQFARLYFFDSASSTPLGTYDAPAGTFSRTAVISEHGDYAAFIASADVYVVETATGALRWSGNMGATSDPLAISGDGRYLAYGWSTLVVREWTGSIYSLLWTVPGSGHYLRSCAMSSDESTLAAGWYRSGFDQNKVQLFGLPVQAPLWTYTYSAIGGSYQDIPIDIAVTGEGEYIAVASWGDQMNTNPEVHVFHNSSSDPVLTVDTPGSMFDIDIAKTSDGGAYVSVCGKHIHANQSGHGGDLYSLRIEPSTGVPDDAQPVASVVSLAPNVPNPFTPGTSISYSISEEPSSPVVLEVYDCAGRRVRTLVNADRPAGTHLVRWDGTDGGGREVASGVYYYRLVVGSEHRTRRMVLLR